MNKDVIKLLIAEYQQKVPLITFQKREYVIEDSLNYVLSPVHYRQQCQNA
jgi:hypothetical protein